jgi:hypothetical protein
VILDFTPDGRAQALHRDDFDLGFLGLKKVERATDIRFNEKTQLWDICLPDGQGGFEAIPDSMGLPSYETARNVEVDWLDGCRLKNYGLQSVMGLIRLVGARDKFGAGRA